jgi:hypothetical protein
MHCPRQQRKKMRDVPGDLRFHEVCLMNAG